jgi:hypothetical protein
MLLILYNPNNNCFYIKRVNSFIFDKYVGYVNQFNHQICQILYIQDNKFVNCNSYWDYIGSSKSQETNKNKVINRVIDLLNKLKD